MDKDKPNAGTRAKPEPVVLTIEETCLVLRISKGMLYNLIRSGKLVTVKLGRRRMVESESIKAMIEELKEREGT